MAKMKKAVLFLVEGITDQLTFESLLPALIDNSEVKFHLANGDITTVESVTGNKVAALNRLSTVKRVFSIDYEIYYFSRNLEHVLHNKTEDLDRYEKQKLAETFADAYYDRPTAFIEFINAPEFAVNGDYRETWAFTKQGCNSLNRHCNFHLFFRENIGSDMLNLN